MFLTSLSYSIILMDMDNLFYKMRYETDEKIKNELAEEYLEFECLRKLYTLALEDNESFSFKRALEKGNLSLHDSCLFKEQILNSGVTEEEWKKNIEKSFKYMGEEKVLKYVEEMENKKNPKEKQLELGL